MFEDNVTQEDSAGQEGVVGSQEGADQAEAEQGGKENPTGAQAGTREQEQHRDNVRMAAARRRGERDAQSRWNAEIAKLGRTDPTTGKPIRTQEDVIAYFNGLEEQELQSEAKKSGRSVQELRTEREQLNRGRAALEEERGERERESFLRQDVEDFRADHPEVELKQLLEDKAFNRFAGKRLGKEPLSELYEDYLAFSTDIQHRAGARKQEKDERSTGAGGTTASDQLTAEQQRRLTDWNREHPDMKMTAKEYLER